jgi:HlyD family secretion protein
MSASPPKPRLDELRIERRETAGHSKGIWPAIAGIVAVLLVLGAIWFAKRPKPIEFRNALARDTGGASVVRTVLNASGYVTARRAATVSSKVTGKVIEVLVEEGMKVQQGQVLARLDDTNVKASLRLTEAQLESARKTLEETRVRITEAERELKRQANLVTNQIATQADFEHA